MIRSNKYTVFIDSLRQSLNHCQYENLGMPFDKGAQHILLADNYATMEEFMDESRQKIETLSKDYMAIYVQEAYEEITRFGVLFGMLVKDYEQVMAGNGRSKLSYESYCLVHAYWVAIESTANEIRRDATLYLALNLQPFRELTIDSYNISGRFIIEENGGGKKEPVVDSFPKLFFNPTDLQDAVDILHKTTTDNKLKVIDLNKRWLGKERDGSRSILLAWVEVLRVQGWFQVSISNKQISGLLNNYFTGLKLSITDDSLWRKQKDSTTANGYHADFLQLIKKR